MALQHFAGGFQVNVTSPRTSCINRLRHLAIHTIEAFPPAVVSPSIALSTNERATRRSFLPSHPSSV